MVKNMNSDNNEHLSNNNPVFHFIGVFMAMLEYVSFVEEETEDQIS